MTTTVYASIGNSDDKLTQQEWSEFLRAFHSAVQSYAAHIHGEWHSAPTSLFQNACACFEITERDAEDLRALFGHMADRFRQDSIAWAVAPVTEFLTSPETTQ